MNSHEPEPARERPYAPAKGDVVQDSGSKKIGRVMGHVGPYVQLRPVAGGQEWDARPENLAPVKLSEALSAAVAEANRHSGPGWWRL
ncbi:hypothetical protein [Streptomyces sp. NPDC057910]|uniref:hypothetical protein n=1 Tax=Streptomyces sp. NPDC057910 TaxID=3346278 RepID=UPI0036E1A679